MQITIETDRPICDFCSDPAVVKSYACGDYVISDSWSPDGQPKVDLGSKGGWAACRECARLIDEGEQAALMERSLFTFYQRYPEVNDSERIRRELKKFLYDLHKEFWERKRA